jgi:flavin-dependent dehydrogenase
MRLDAARFDAAIIGGGLAGCSAAIRLAQHGFRVALFEAKRYPHHKVCGEFLSPECTPMLDALGVLPGVLTHAPAQITYARITVPNGDQWQTDLPGTGIGISRYVLDALLARQAQACGVRVFEGMSVEDVQGTLVDGFTLRTANDTHQARLVIGAYGKRGKLDKTLDRRFLRHAQPYVGLKTHRIGAPVPERVDLHSFPGGYCGISEIENGRANVCLLVRQEVFQRYSDGRKIEAFVAWMQRQNPHLDDWLSSSQETGVGWLAIAQVPFVPKRAVENDILMAGDSAGLIAPLAGDGMAMALAGGIRAADFGARFLHGALTPEGLTRGYKAAWHGQFDARLRLGRWLQAFMLRPAALTMGLRVVRHVPALGSYFVQHTRDHSQ